MMPANDLVALHLLEGIPLPMLLDVEAADGNRIPLTEYVLALSRAGFGRRIKKLAGEWAERWDPTVPERAVLEELQ